MESKKELVLTGFNKQFNEFTSFVQKIFPEDVDIITMNNSLSLLQKKSPSLIIEVWDKFISVPYQAQIKEGDIEFFFNKDYTEDVKGLEESKFIIQKVNSLREFVKGMNQANRLAAFKYIQKMSSLSRMYIG